MHLTGLVDSFRPQRPSHPPWCPWPQGACRCDPPWSAQVPHHAAGGISGSGVPGVVGNLCWRWHPIAGCWMLPHWNFPCGRGQTWARAHWSIRFYTALCSSQLILWSCSRPDRMMEHTFKISLHWRLLRPSQRCRERREVAQWRHLMASYAGSQSCPLLISQHSLWFQNVPDAQDSVSFLHHQREERSISSDDSGGRLSANQNWALSQNLDLHSISWPINPHVFPSNFIIWRFPIHGGTLVIIHFHRIFHEINHPIHGGTPKSSQSFSHRKAMESLDLRSQASARPWRMMSKRGPVYLMGSKWPIFIEKRMVHHYVII